METGLNTVGPGMRVKGYSKRYGDWCEHSWTGYEGEGLLKEVWRLV